MQAVSVRLEAKRLESGSEWVKVDSAYLKDVVITSDSVLIGKHRFK